MSQCFILFAAINSWGSNMFRSTVVAQESIYLTVFLWRAEMSAKEFLTFPRIIGTYFLHHFYPLLSSHSDPGQLRPCFKLFLQLLPTKLLFHVLSTVNNSCNSWNTNLDGHLTYIILFITQAPSNGYYHIACFTFFFKVHILVCITRKHSTIGHK